MDLNARISSKLISSVLILLLVPGCISSLFKEPKPTFSDEIKLPKLSAEYVKINQNNTYPSWRNQNSHNVIAVISDCAADNEQLKTIHTLITDHIASIQYTSEGPEKIDAKNTYFKKYKGLIDGKPVAVHSYSFYSGYCMYLASLSGNPQTIQANEADLINFIKEIQFKK